MIPTGLVQALRTVDQDITAEDLADSIWLASWMTAGSAAVANRPPAAQPAVPLAASAESGPRPPPEPVPAAEPAESAPYHRGFAELRVAGSVSGLAETDPAVRTRSPGVPALPDALDLCRALRPLRRRIPSATATYSDEEATAQQIADTGVWASVELPVPERWLDLALVVDAGDSMVVWQQLRTELRRLLLCAGVFRDIRVWLLDSDRRDRSRPMIRGEEESRAVGREPRELVDPSGRRLVLVVSDCVGTAWGDGSLAEPLAEWARAGPAAVLQLLPQRLWPDCQPDFLSVRFRATGPGLPTSTLAFEHEDDDLDRMPPGLAIPVLALEPRWVAPWAELVAGTAPGWTDGVAVFTGLLARQSADGPPEEPEPPPSPAERLRRFRARCSTTAYRLAVLFAAAPLSLPVMRLVQHVMLPKSRPSHLAEVFLGDLLRRVAPSDTADVDPEDLEFDFEPGVREQLMAELTRPDALQILYMTSNFVAARLGSPFDFRALLTTRLPADGTPELSPPFARVAYQVLHSLGGRYAEAAKKLVPALPAHPEGDDVTTGGAPVQDRPGWRQTKPAIMRGIPPRNPHFTGRVDLLDQLRRALMLGSERTALLPHALHGLGGVGKTQLAIEYAYRHSADYELIWWVTADDPAEVRSSLADLASLLNVPESADVAKTVANVLDALGTGQPYRRWLLVFDNADQPEELRQYLPNPIGHILITSRNQVWAEVANAVEVNVFSRAESVALLQQRGHDISTDDAHRLAEQLGDLPLALEQAAAWQAETGMPVTEYIQLLNERTDLLGEKPPANYPTPVAATWSLGFERLHQNSVAAAQLMELCAFFGPAPISLDLLWTGRHADLPSPLGETLRDSIQLRRAVREISHYALARIDATNNRIQVHRLVQAVLRSNLTPERRAQNQASVQAILAQANPGQPDLRQHWERHAELSAHIMPARAIDSADVEVRRVILDQIRYRYARGDYESSRELGEVTVKTWASRWGDDDELTLIACRHLANALRALGHTREARDLDEDTFARQKRVFGENHEHTLATATSVGSDLRATGHFGEARRLDEDNLARHRRVFGDDDPSTLRTANSLAVDLRLLGDYAGANVLDRDTVRRERDLYGDDDPRTLFVVSNHARDLLWLGEYDAALRMQEEALAAQRHILGDNHNEVLLSVRTMAILLRKLGRYRRAQEMASENYTACRNRLGPNHENTLAAMTTYCNSLRTTGQVEQARSMCEDALGRYRRDFGDEHQFTLYCSINLAVILRHGGHYREALALNETMLPTLRRVVGPDHPGTLCCALNTSNDLSGLHEHGRARELSADTLRRSIELRGPEHPYTLSCAVNAALDRMATGEADLGRSLFEEALASLVRKLGANHPEVIAAAAERRADCDIEPSPT